MLYIKVTFDIRVLEQVKLKRFVKPATVVYSVYVPSFIIIYRSLGVCGVLLYVYKFNC